MKRVPSDDVSVKSWEPAEPPAIGRIGGRESLSTHMASSFFRTPLLYQPYSRASIFTLAPGEEATRRGRGRWTTRHACAAPLRLGSIWARHLRFPLEGTGPV